MSCTPSCEKAGFKGLMFMGGAMNHRIPCVECYEYLNSDDKIGLDWGYPLREVDKTEPFVHPFFLDYKMDDNWKRHSDRYLSIHRGVDFHTAGDRDVLAIADGSIFRICGEGLYMHHESNGQCYTTYYMHVKGNSYQKGISFKKGEVVGTIKHGKNIVHIEIYRTRVNRGAESSRLYQSGPEWVYGFLRDTDVDLLNPLELMTSG